VQGPGFECRVQDLSVGSRIRVCRVQVLSVGSRIRV
jgi:hypothetical protein